MIPAIKWEGSDIHILDQRKLPQEKDWIVCRSIQGVISAIRKMAIRGAPAIGIAAAMGMALGAESIASGKYEDFKRNFLVMADRMKSARPTAVNLAWAVKRMTDVLDEMKENSTEDIKRALKRESILILEQDKDINRKIGINGLDLVPQGSTILTHCNAGALATGGHGTALGVVRAAREAEKDIRVIVDETRPLLQGARLTAFELKEEGIPYKLIVDGAAGYLMRKGKVDLVITGADRIASNGDTANKIGTYQLGVLAKENNIPFYIAAPLSTFDPGLKNGDSIPVEQREPAEVTSICGRPVSPEDSDALNPAFDITPARYISAIITEKGVIIPPYKSAIGNLLENE